MKKILFLLLPTTPYYKFSESDNSVYKGVFAPSLPLGIASISAYLKKNVGNIVINAVDITELIHNANAEDDELQERSKNLDYTNIVSDVLKRYENDPPDIIGISALYNIVFTNVVYTSKLIKQFFPSSLLVVGGALVSTMYHQLLTEAPVIDALCFGEGEQPLFELISADDIHNYLSASKSWITKEKVNLRPEMQYEVTYVDDYDSLPFPDYDLFDLDRYQKFNRDHSKKTNKYVASVIFSRGCPFDCNFCVANMLHGRKVRHYSAAKAKEYVKYMIGKFHVTGLAIEDNNFLFNKKWSVEMLLFLAEQDIEIDLTNGLYINSLDEELILLLKKAKLNNMLFPIESGSKRVLRELMNKNTDLEHAKKMILFCHAQSLQVQANFIVGYPGETPDDIEKTRAFVEDIGVFDWVRFFAATPFHGSHLYKLCKENDYLVTEEYDKFSGDYPIIKTPEFTPEDIQFLSYKLNLLYNFVNNYKMKTGDYSGALNRFLQIEKKVEGHAFALYYGGICCEKLGDYERAKELFARYAKSINDNKEWKMWNDLFSLPPLKI